MRPASDWITPQGIADLVSIVVPTCNRAVLLQETLGSLLNQTYRPLEIIIVGDGIEDHTAEIVDQAKSSAPEGVDIQYFTQPRAGGPAARNTGARRTTGEFIVFMDDDDIPTREFVASRVAALRRANANVAFGIWQTFVVDNAGIYHLLDARGFMPEGPPTVWTTFLTNWDLLLQGCVLRRSLVSKTGPWDETLHKSQDLDYKARLFASDCRPIYCKEGMVYYRIHDKSISGGLDAHKLDSYVAVLDHIETLGLQQPDYEETKTFLANYFWLHGFWLYGRGDFRRGYAEIQRAKRHVPDIGRQKGLTTRFCDIFGLDILIGPAYYFLSQVKKSMGLSKRRFTERRTQLMSKER